MQRTVEQTLVDSMDKAVSQIMEENFEVDNIVLPERIPDKICVRNGVIEATKTSSQDLNLLRAVEQDSVEVDTTTPQDVPKTAPLCNWPFGSWPYVSEDPHLRNTKKMQVQQCIASPKDGQTYGQSGSIAVPKISCQDRGSQKYPSRANF